MGFQFRNPRVRRGRLSEQVPVGERSQQIVRAERKGHHPAGLPEDALGPLLLLLSTRFSGHDLTSAPRLLEPPPQKSADVVRKSGTFRRAAAEGPGGVGTEFVTPKTSLIQFRHESKQVLYRVRCFRERSE